MSECPSSSGTTRKNPIYALIKYSKTNQIRARGQKNYAEGLSKPTYAVCLTFETLTYAEKPRK